MRLTATMTIKVTTTGPTNGLILLSIVSRRPAAPSRGSDLAPTD